MTSFTTGRGYLDAVLEQPGSVLALAHRGGARHPEIEGFENTMVAFEHAVALGYGYLETDVHVTSDGVLLAFHDDVLDRVTDRSGRVGSMRYADVRGAVIGGRAEIPRLDHLFEALPDVRFNIDIKSEGAVRALADFVAVRGAWDRVLVGSFSRSRMHDFRRSTRGRVATSATPSEVAAFMVTPHAALARRVAGGFDALQVPRSRGRLRIVTPGLLRRAHAGGVHVHVWTIDQDEEMRELLDLGVDGLITDRTDVLRDVLVERGQWRESTT